MQTEETYLKRRAELSAAKLALLEKRLRQAASLAKQDPSGTPTNTIPRRPQEGPAVLSFAQERLWFLQQLEPESAAYNEAIAVYLRGPLDIHALTQTGREIFRRHEVLRSTFPVIDGQAVQVISPDAHLTFTLPVIDLQSIPPAERDVEVKRSIAEEMQRPFELTEELPWRTFLLRLDEEEHVSVTILHHITTDAWTTEVFVREIGMLYSAFCAGQSSPLPEPPIQYADYACWQRQLLDQGAMNEQLTYWKQHLGGSLPVLELPTDRPRPIVQTYHGQHLPFVLSRSVTQALQALSRQEGATLFMTLLAAFNVLLYCYSQQEDILVGSPIAGRTRPELEHLLGCFVNTLVLRTDLSGNPTFHELLARVREVALAAYAHQDVPFEKLVEELQPARSLTHSPLFQTMFTLQNIPLAEQKLAGLTISPAEVENNSSKFDLSLTLQETPAQELSGYLEYNTDLFDASTVERMLGHFHRIVEAMLTDMSQHITGFPLLTSAEWQQQVVDWNVTQKVRQAQTVPFSQLFEAQVARTPDAVAVRCEGEQLTYRELQERAGWLAGHLSACGVGPESLVALLADRSLAFLTAMLAVFQVGAAYLPLDPHHPVARLRQVLTHSGCPLVLSTSTFSPLLEEVSTAIPSETRPRLLTIEDLQATSIENAPTGRGQTVHNLAYVIYTSGSTGAPKGVMVEQEGMLNHLYAKIEALHLTESDRVAQTASQCFDISVWQFLAALLVGGQVHIFPDEVAHDPSQLLAQIEQRHITIVETVPSLLRAIIESGETDSSTPADLSALRWMIPTGEALPPELCRRWLSLYPAIPLLNAYGPTECSDDVTHSEISEPPAETVVVTPIGRAVPNLQLYVLDRALRPVPLGVSGELYVGGVGVGRGYVQDPVRTAETFVPDPFSAVPGSRLYRTGDLARSGVQGELEFLGRIDHQVKLRGYRIELGEIETVLNQHPSVQANVVMAREDEPGNKLLVAYLVLDQKNLPKRGEVRDFLVDRLPEYMVPNTFVLLEALPLTPNGKLDRKALPPPHESAITLEFTAYVAPRTPLEIELANIWAEIMGLERVGIQDNFFEIGGHSLLIAQLIARIRDSFHIDIPFKALFKTPTVMGLAESMEKIKARSEELRKPSVTPVAREAYRLKRPSSHNSQAGTGVTVAPAGNPVTMEE